MAMQVKMCEETYRYAEWLTRITGRSAADVLALALGNTARFGLIG